MSLLARAWRRVRRGFSPTPRAIDSAPFALDHFDSLLSALTQQLGSGVFGSRGSTRGLVLRLDLDTPECLQRVHEFVCRANAVSVTPVASFRVDGIPYPLESAAQAIERLRESGTLLALHSSCYLGQASPSAAIDRLKQELETFRQVSGTPARNLTFHGEGTQDAQVRSNVRELLVQGLAESLELATDLPDSRWDYNYVFQDCSRDQSGRRVIRTDWASPRRFKQRSEDVLVLVHPGYWSA